MYETSAAVAAAIEQYSRTFRAKLVFEDDGYVIGGDTERTVVDYKLQGGSCATHDLKIGSTMCATIEMHLGYKETVSLLRRDCKMYISILLNSVFVDIPFGKYTIRDSDSASGQTVLYLADYMYKLDRDYKTSLVFPNTVENIVADISHQFGFDYDVGTLHGLVIGNVPVGMSYRNIIGHIAAMNGKFAVFDRDGTLRYKWYEAANYAINNDIITDPTVSEADYVVGFLDVQLADGSYKTLPEEAESEQGISIANPFMSDSAMQIAWNTVKDFAYRPATVKMLLGDPRIDPWDILTLNVGDAEYSVPVMTLSFEFDGGLSCELAATATTEDSEYQTPTQRQQSQTQADIKSATYVIFANNVIDVDIDMSSKRLLRLAFAVTENATPYMIVTAQVEITTPGTLLFTVTVNGSAYTYHRQLCAEGDNLITFMIPFVSLSTTGSHSVEVLISSEDAAGIILNDNAKAILTGSGTSGAGAWDGLITVSDGVRAICVDIPEAIRSIISPFSDNADVGTVAPGSVSQSDNISAIRVDIPSATVVSFSGIMDRMRYYPVVRQAIIYPANEAEYIYNRDFIDISENTFKLRRAYEYHGTAQTVDSGQLTSVSLPLNAFDSVSEVEVEE